MNIKLCVSRGRYLFTAGCLATLFSCGGRYDEDSPVVNPDLPPASTPDSAVLDAKIETNVTNVGGTYTVDGMVTVLVPDTSTESFTFFNGDRTGMSLYIFDNDPVDASICNTNACVDSWPPLLAASDTNAQPPLSVVTRDDGSTQWALRGKPLYFFSGDTNTGDVNGEGTGGVWHVAKSEPVILVDDSVTSNAGEYFVASGKVSLSVPASDGSTTEFVAQNVDMEGMSLYTFDNDETGVSSCFGGCLVNWPALLADTGDVAEAPYSIIDRQMNEDGSTAKQWAYNGKPLYFFSQDIVVGDTNGKDIANWTLVRPHPIMVSDSSEGQLLLASGLVKTAKPDGDSEVIAPEPKHLFSLYTFDNDTLGVSNCNGACLDSWPAVMADEDAVATAPYSLVERNTGEKQWALNGLPLYLFNADAAPGDTNGDGVGGVWHLARKVTITQNVTSIGGTYTVDGAITILTDSFDVAIEDRRGMSLYHFDNDPVGNSACNSVQCVASWPPLLAPTNASADAPLSVISRDDGNGQWALRGKPLYFFAGDSEPGDVNGEGVGGVWHTAQNEPVVLVDENVATAGEYLVASGKVAVSTQESSTSTDSFVAEHRNMEGMSLYTFDNDLENQSSCFGQCLVNWPALLADTGDVAEAPYSIIDRQMNDIGGTARQWAYKGKPLYFFFQDTVPGDTFGKDVGNWALLRPRPFMAVEIDNGAILVASGLVKSVESDSDGNEVTFFAPKHGSSLYTFDNDTESVSNCTGGCLNNWPALIAHEGAVAELPYSLVLRGSGEQQWALEGKPLYFYSLDVNPGDTLGDGVGSVWHLIERSAEEVDSGDEDDADGGYGY